MYGWRVALALAAAIPGVAVAKDREPEVLTRTGKWVLEYNRDACHLFAEFGEGDAQVVARFTRYQPGDGFDLALYGKRFRTADVRSEAKIDFGLAGAPVERGVTFGNAGKLPAVFIGSMRVDGWSAGPQPAVPPRITPEQEAKVSGVTVAVGRRARFRLEFGSLGKPLAQMRDCSANLVRSWGYDPDVQAALLRPASPIVSPATWLSPNDYPSDAVRMGYNGIVQVRLDVDAEGRVAGCFVLARTSPDEFADTTCRAVSKRAKLQPALDATGRPVRSYFLYKVNWQVRI
jgi:TonB family protein